MTITEIKNKNFEKFTNAPGVHHFLPEITSAFAFSQASITLSQNRSNSGSSSYLSS